MQIRDVEAAHAFLPARLARVRSRDVAAAGAAAHALVSPRAERVWTLARQHDHSHLDVFPRLLECV